MLNNYQARWQWFADFVGLGFAQGKTLFWRKSDLEGAGGIRALGSESAEDAACTKIVRKLGLRVRLMQPPVRQPLGCPPRRRCLEAAAALGAAAAGKFPVLVFARNLLRLARPPRRHYRGGDLGRVAGARAGIGLCGGHVLAHRADRALDVLGVVLERGSAAPRGLPS